MSSSTNDLRDVAAIDVHAHYGRMVRDRDPLYDTWMSGDAATVAARARAVNIRWTMVSPLLALMPRGKADAAAGNDEATDVVERTDGLLQWAVLNPLQPATFDQVERLLARPRCVGIKIHPEEHRYEIRDQGDTIFAFAARHRAIVLSHRGQPLSMPGDLRPFADAHPEVRLILAHIGCADDEDMTRQAAAAAGSRHRNVYADTSSAKSMISGVIEHAVDVAGADRVLFGTDTPLYSAAAQRARIEQAELSEEARRLILHDNAAALFGLA